MDKITINGIVYTGENLHFPKTTQTPEFTTIGYVFRSIAEDDGSWTYFAKIDYGIRAMSTDRKSWYICGGEYIYELRQELKRRGTK